MMETKDFKWYVVKTISGKEEKVKTYIEKELEHQKMDKYVSSILIPTEKIFQIKNGKKISKERNFFPGYLLIQANLFAELIHTIRNVLNVIGFLGETKGGVPLPIRKAEVNRILGKVDELANEEEQINIPFFVGEPIKVTDGPFNGFTGSIDVVNEEKCMSHDLNDVVLLSPIPNPNSLRDAYAFRQHVETSRRNRGLEMIKEFDEFPVFYFSNHNSIYGPNDDIMCMPSHFDKLDFELEIAIVIGKQGRNIKAKNASQYIAGFMIMNDLSARGLQMKEMRLNLGPAKGKDFASVLGPFLVTPDELENKIISSDQNGNKYDLKMTCSLNGHIMSEGNFGSIDWTFEQIIERVSYGSTIFPGDVIGSGTVGTGCLPELNGTNKLNNPNYNEIWLKEGDLVEMSIEGLGQISNKITLEDSKYHIN